MVFEAFLFTEILLSSIKKNSWGFLWHTPLPPTHPLITVATNQGVYGGEGVLSFFSIEFREYGSQFLILSHLNLRVFSFELVQFWKLQVSPFYFQPTLSLSEKITHKNNTKLYREIMEIRNINVTLLSQ